MNLRTYSGEKLSVLGEANVHVDYKGRSCQLVLRVVKGSGPSFLVETD